MYIHIYIQSYICRCVFLHLVDVCGSSSPYRSHSQANCTIIFSFSYLKRQYQKKPINVTHIWSHVYKLHIIYMYKVIYHSFSFLFNFHNIIFITKDL